MKNAFIIIIIGALAILLAVLYRIEADKKAEEQYFLAVDVELDDRPSAVLDLSCDPSPGNYSALKDSRIGGGSFAELALSFVLQDPNVSSGYDDLFTDMLVKNGYGEKDISALENTVLSKEFSCQILSSRRFANEVMSRGGYEEGILFRSLPGSSSSRKGVYMQIVYVMKPTLSSSYYKLFIYDEERKKYIMVLN